MAITNKNPAANSVISPADSFAFDIDDTYTSLVVKVTQSGGDEYAYDSTLGGAQAGYVVTVEDIGSQDRVTITRSAGWNKEPTSILVVENETGSSVQTAYQYYLTATAIYPEGMQPYAAAYDGSLLVTESDVSVRNDVGWIDFDADGFEVTDMGNGKVAVGLDTLSLGATSTTGMGIWTLTNSTAGTQQMKWDFLAPGSTTRIDFHDDREGGADVYPILLDTVRTNDYLLFERASGATAQYAYFKVTNDPSYNSPETIFNSIVLVDSVGTFEVGHSISCKVIKGIGAAAPDRPVWAFDDSLTTTPATGTWSLDHNTVPTTMYIHESNADGIERTSDIVLWGGDLLYTVEGSDPFTWLRATMSTPSKSGDVYTIGLTDVTLNLPPFTDASEFTFQISQVAVDQEFNGGIGYWMPSYGIGPPSWTDPSAGTVGVGDVVMSDCIDMYFNYQHYLNTEAWGLDHSSILLSLKAGDKILFREKFNPAEAAIFTLDVDAVASGGHCYLEVTADDTTGNVWPPMEMAVHIIRKPAPLAGSGAGIPGMGDDINDGYSVLSFYHETTNDDVYVCVDNSAGAAVWKIAAT